jgi:hypothetical protein
MFQTMEENTYSLSSANSEQAFLVFRNSLFLLAISGLDSSCSTR